MQDRDAGGRLSGADVFPSGTGGLPSETAGLPRGPGVFPSETGGLPSGPDVFPSETDILSSGTGVLLVNLGTPVAPRPGAIRAFLGEFLSDPRVVELPRLLWLPLLYGLILVRRPHKLAPRYQNIWMEEGAPLLVYSRRQAQALAHRLAARGLQVAVAVGMRYGAPSIADSLTSLRARGCERILIVPMYPQYAASTTASVMDAVAAYIAPLRDQPELRFIKRFCTDPGYLDAVAQGVERFWQERGKAQRLLMSFHGLPCAMIKRGDPYYQDCLATGRLLGARLKLTPLEAPLSFQSRFGAGRWLGPATTVVLQDLAAQGVRKVDVVCPGFLADCLETLDEIQEECRAVFIAAGGYQLRYIPAVNDDSAWSAALADLVMRHLQGWPTRP